MGKKVLFLGMALSPIMASGQEDAVIVNHINDVTHIEISGLGASDYTLNRKGKSIELKVSQLSEGKLNALKNYKDKHISSVDVQKSPALDQDIVTFKLASNTIEIFDYLTDAPSSLSIDFYVDEEKPDSAAAAIESSEQKKSKNKGEKGQVEDGKVAKDNHIDESYYKNLSLERQLASDEFVKTIANTSLLMDLDDKEPVVKKIPLKELVKPEKKKVAQTLPAKDPLDIDMEKVKFPLDILIEARDQVYLRFPILLNESEYLNSIVTRPVAYEVEELQDPETKDFIKAKKMFDKKDFKLFFKSRKIFTKKYPNSQYIEMISFMAADALLMTYGKEKSPELLNEALRMYDMLIAKYPGSSITERTYLLLAYLRMKEKKYLDAARTLKTYVELYKSSPLRENINLILAQSLMRTKQYRDAGLIYEELSRSNSADVREAASFEKGDVFLEKKDYENAIKYYHLALSQYPQAAKKYANIHFNLAEAQFMNEDYKYSLKSYRNFLAQHPQHPFSAYAWTRMGEILQIANKEESIWRGFYNESLFRFNNDEGARIARVHLIRQDAVRSQDHKLELYINELKALMKEIHLPYIEDFITFQISDIYFARGDYRTSVEYLLTFFKQSQIPIESEKFHRRIGRSLAGLLQNEIEHGTADSAIRQLKEYDELWLNKSKLLTFNYFKGRIYAKAGMHDVAQSYYNKYLKSIEGISQDKTSEKLIPASTVYLHATRNQMNAKRIPDALATYAKIVDSDLSPKEKVEFVRLQRDISIARNDFDTAIQQASAIEPATKEDYLVLAEVYDKKNEHGKAVETIDTYVNTFKPQADEKFEVLKNKVDYLSKSEDKEKYKSFLKRFFSEFKDSKKNFDKEKYDLGKLYIEEGNVKDANEVVGRISKGSIWAKLAAEYTEQENWDQKYKKYIDRVPAMKSKEGGK